jgi:hypothetical protein
MPGDWPPKKSGFPCAACFSECRENYQIQYRQEKLFFSLNNNPSKSCLLSKTGNPVDETVIRRVDLFRIRIKTTASSNEIQIPEINPPPGGIGGFCSAVCTDIPGISLHQIKAAIANGTFMFFHEKYRFA